MTDMPALFSSSIKSALTHKDSVAPGKKPGSLSYDRRSAFKASSFSRTMTRPGLIMPVATGTSDSRM